MQFHPYDYYPPYWKRGTVTEVLPEAPGDTKNHKVNHPKQHYSGDENHHDSVQDIGLQRSMLYYMEEQNKLLSNTYQSLQGLINRQIETATMSSVITTEDWDYPQSDIEDDQEWEKREVEYYGDDLD